MTTATKPKLTVALSVYDGVDLELLRVSVGSILAQDDIAYEFCIVLDGINRADLRDYLEEICRNHDHIHLIRFDQNRKLPAAMNAIIAAMKTDFFVRMDADDISLPKRLSALYNYMMANPEIDAAGSASFEFADQPPEKGLKRVYPESHDQIVQAFNYNNPFCHPSMIFRRRFFEHGLYPLWTLNEDTLLFLNGLAGGARYGNLSEPLYGHRYDADVGHRRQGWRRAFVVFMDRQRVISHCGGGLWARMYATALLLGQTLGGPFYNIVRHFLLQRRNRHRNTVHE